MSAVEILSILDKHGVYVPAPLRLQVHCPSVPCTEGDLINLLLARALTYPHAMDELRSL